MHALLYFDTEDFFSPPDSPVHALPGQMAEIMSQHGLPGCFHVHGEKARHMEEHGQTDVIEALRQHDVSLHFDRGSIHPTTAEEVSSLDWFEAVDRVIFREVPGVQSLQRMFGKCSALTQHGGTFAAPIVYAAGKLGLPFFYSPFRLAERNIVWFCNNLLIGGYQADFSFDRAYHTTPEFTQRLALIDSYIETRAQTYDFTAMFGCHPVNTIMDRFPDAINFAEGATPPVDEWVAPELIEDVSVPTVLQNFEDLVQKLVAQPDVEWTTVEGLSLLYGRRPARVADDVVIRGAEEAVSHGAPTFTAELSAGELLYLLARHALSPEETYDVPQVMGPLQNTPDHLERECVHCSALPEEIASEMLTACDASGYMPAVFCEARGGASRRAKLY